MKSKLVPKKEIKKIKPPFTVAIIDLLDAYHYADIFDDYRYAVVGKNFIDFKVCMGLADRLFWALNPDAKNQEDWTEYDVGWDVRVYDNNYSCLYKAHEKLPREELKKSELSEYNASDHGLMTLHSKLQWLKSSDPKIYRIYDKKGNWQEMGEHYQKEINKSRKKGLRVELQDNKKLIKELEATIKRVEKKN